MSKKKGDRTELNQGKESIDLEAIVLSLAQSVSDILRSISLQKEGDLLARMIFEQAELPKEARVGLVVNCLRGYAADWIAYRENEFSSFEEFKEAFKKRYWGNKEERELYNEIHYGRYSNSNASDSLNDNFLKLIRQSRYLSTSMSEEELMNKLSQHFSDETRRGIIINGFKKVDDVESYLRDIDLVSGSRERN